MHDIDRVRFESEAEFEQNRSNGIGQSESEAFEAESFEYGETDSPIFNEAESVFGEADEMELAGELLEAGTDQELDQFLGKLIRRAGQAVGRAVCSPGGRAIGGLLKGAARKVLPGIGSSIGSYFGGTRGAQIGSQAASSAGRLFGLELEGLSGEDQEFEVARRFVRFSGEAVRNLTEIPDKRNMPAAARAATIAAAKLHAPGLLQPQAGQAPSVTTPAMAGRPQSGHWKRRGNKIVVLGL
jgi:hypothetical protein